MRAVRPASTSRLSAALIPGLLIPALLVTPAGAAGAVPGAAPSSVAPARTVTSTGATVPSASVPSASAPLASAPSATVAADVRQPKVKEVRLSGISRKVLAKAPDPHGDGTLGALSTANALQPAIAASIKVAKPAELVAVTADQDFPAGTSIQVRVKEKGRWSPWTELHVDPEHGPDPGSDEAAAARPGSDPLMTRNATRVQVRIDTPTGSVPKGTELTLVNAPSAESDKPTATLSAMATVGQPPIVTRSQWGADESWRSREPYYTGDLRAGFVHHTASTSSYTAAKAAAQIRAIYAYHTKSLGHSDIDYNFLIDRFGRLYEGRYGGMDRPVLGGHTAGFNEHTFAVSALGNFETFSPSASDMAAIKDSIARLFAWKLGMYGVNPAADVQLVSAGFVKAIRYPRGTVATISATSSHQTVNFTSCPGKYLQAQLGAIRKLGGAYSDVVISAPSPTGRTVVAGETGSVSFTASTNRAVRWTADVLSPCSDTPVRSFSGSTNAAGPISISWDLRDSTGAPALPATYTIRVTGTAADGTPVAAVASELTIAPAPGGAWGPCANASRVVGTGSASTSVLWGRIAAPGTRVVVLTAPADQGTSSFAAGLAAAPLARSLDAPLLMTPRTALAEEVAAEIRSRGATQVLVVGGSDVVSDSVAAAVSSLGVPVTRLAGATPAGTAAAVAARMGAGTSAVVVSPDGSTAHALAGAALAAARRVPVLLAAGADLPAETRTALSGRRSVTVASSTVLADATVAAALPGVAWDRLTGADAAGASLAVGAAFPATAQTAMLLPESQRSWAVAPVAAASGVPLLLTPSPILAPAIADYLRARPALRATTTPVSSSWLDDKVLGASSRVLLGLPWAPGAVVVESPPPAAPTASSGPTATTKRKVYRTNASPEPIRKGKTIKVRAKVKARFTDGKYRKVPAGVDFRLQFKKKGKKYRTVATGQTIKGKAKTYVTAKKSGRWRIIVGKKKSKSDYVKVRK